MEKEERIYNLSIDNEFIDKVSNTDVNRMFEHKGHFYLIKSTHDGRDCCDNCIFKKNGVDCFDINYDNNNCKRGNINVDINEISKERFKEINRMNNILDSVKKDKEEVHLIFQCQNIMHQDEFGCSFECKKEICEVLRKHFNK